MVSRVRAKIDQRERTESSGSVDGEQRAEKMQRESIKRGNGEQREKAESRVGTRPNR